MQCKRLSRKVWLMVAALTLTWSLYFLHKRTSRVRAIPTVRGSIERVVSDGRPRTEEVDKDDDLNGAFVIRSPGCSIPRYPTFSRAVLPHLDTGKPPVDCLEKYKKKEGLQLKSPPIESNSTHVFVASPYQGQSCCYRSIRREITQNSKWADNSFRMSAKCTEFAAGSGLHVTESEEFVEVTCRVSLGGESGEVMDMHAVPVVKKVVEQRCEEKSSALNPEEKENRLNLLIVGLDATSRLNFHRQMPQTREFLEELGAIELVGYNKVADNTFPNIVPLMTGLTESELKKRCWRTAFDKLDDCPWLWYRFVERGYRTAMVEDAPNIGIFNFERMGFQKQASDYYLRPYILATEQILGHFNYPTVLLCLGPRLALEVVLGYTTKFSEAFFVRSEHPSFAFAWSTTMTHDGLALTKEADPIVARELRRTLTPQARARTALLFISDHGVRTGDFRQTPQGSQEERLPFAFLALPQSFREKFPEATKNLRNNGGGRLTTPFDLHFTLADLLDPRSSLSPDVLERRAKEIESSKTLPRGMSLFLPVPETRECSDAGVSDHWCTCVVGSDEEKWARGGTGPALLKEEADKAGWALVELINGILKRSPEAATVCANLSLHEVLEVRGTGERGKGLMVRMRTYPGGAVFEGTMAKRNDTLADELLEWVLGTDVSSEGNVGISRLNRYGNQSACIDDYHLKIFCYCITGAVENVSN